MTQVGKPEQTIGFQSFRMRIFEVRGYCPYYEKSTFHVFEISEAHFLRLRSKAFSPACPFRFPNFLYTASEEEG